MSPLHPGEAATWEAPSAAIPSLNIIESTGPAVPRLTSGWHGLGAARRNPVDRPGTRGRGPAPRSTFREGGRHGLIARTDTLSIKKNRPWTTHLPRKPIPSIPYRPTTPLAVGPSRLPDPRALRSPFPHRLHRPGKWTFSGTGPIDLTSLAQTRRFVLAQRFFCRKPGRRRRAAPPRRRQAFFPFRPGARTKRELEYALDRGGRWRHGLATACNQRSRLGFAPGPRKTTGGTGFAPQENSGQGNPT